MKLGVTQRKDTLFINIRNFEAHDESSQSDDLRLWFLDLFCSILLGFMMHYSRHHHCWIIKFDDVLKISIFLLLINKNYSKYHEEENKHQCDFRLRVVYCSVILKNDKTGPNNTITVIGNNKQIYQHINEAIQLHQRKLFKNLCWWLSLSAQMHHRRRNSCDRRERGGDVITCFVCLITVTKWKDTICRLVSLTDKQANQAIFTRRGHVDSTNVPSPLFRMIKSDR